MGGRLGWRHIVPRRRYFRSLRVARVCPEIAEFVDAQAAVDLRVGLLAALWWPTIGLFRLVVLGLSAISDLLPGLPDTNAAKGEIIERAWAVLPLDEIKRRMGEAPAVLATKPAGRAALSTEEPKT